MATLLEIQTFTSEGHMLRQRFISGRMQVAWNILAEVGGGTTLERRAWRLKIFNNPKDDLDREYNWFLSHTSVQTSGSGISDAALVAAVGSFVDAWATVVT